MDFAIYLDERGQTIVPVLFFLHAILKQTPKIPNWLIPWILTICGMGFAYFMLAPEPPHIRMMQGMIATAFVVFGTTLMRDTTSGVMNGQNKEVLRLSLALRHV